MHKAPQKQQKKFSHATDFILFSFYHIPFAQKKKFLKDGYGRKASLIPADWQSDQISPISHLCRQQG